MFIKQINDTSVALDTRRLIAENTEVTMRKNLIDYIAKGWSHETGTVSATAPE